MPTVPLGEASSQGNRASS